MFDCFYYNRQNHGSTYQDYYTFWCFGDLVKDMTHWDILTLHMNVQVKPVCESDSFIWHENSSQLLWENKNNGLFTQYMHASTELSENSDSELKGPHPRHHPDQTTPSITTTESNKQAQVNSTNLLIFFITVKSPVSLKPWSIYR